jgi:rhomboid protease GluP
VDLNQILFLVAVLNIGGDLYNMYRFRDRLPGWMMPLALSALAICGGAWLFAHEYSGVIAITVLVVYALAIRYYTRRRTGGRSLPAPATKTLIAINCLAFLVQLYFHATDDPARFVELGAMYSVSFESGEWWRLVTAQFLHWGPLHLGCNMLGLWYLGPLAEHALGRGKFVLGYLVSGTGGLLIAWGMHKLSGDTEPMILLGASGAVLGLVGIQGAIALRALRQHENIAAKAQLSAMIQIVVLQALFDSMVPQVSSTAHLGGAAIGFVLGMLMYRPRRPAYILE